MYSVGLLLSKIKNLSPDKRVDWPDPCGDAVRAQSRAELDRSQQRTANGRIAAEHERRKNAEHVAQLEQQYGPQLDKLPKKQLRKFVSEALPGIKVPVPDRGPIPSGFYRTQLLIAIAGEKQNA
jgi:hypothetical protein